MKLTRIQFLMVFRTDGHTISGKSINWGRLLFRGLEMSDESEEKYRQTLGWLYPLGNVFGRICGLTFLVSRDLFEFLLMRVPDAGRAEKLRLKLSRYITANRNCNVDSAMTTFNSVHLICWMLSQSADNVLNYGLPFGESYAVVGDYLTGFNGN